jgi:predicted small metal-binding protein
VIREAVGWSVAALRVPVDQALRPDDAGGAAHRRRRLAELTAAARGWKIALAGKGGVAQKYLDCREIPSETNCTVGIAADSEEELVEAAVQHAVAVHSHGDTPELRSMIRESIKETEAAAV